MSDTEKEMEEARKKSELEGAQRAAMLKNWDDEANPGDGWKLMDYKCVLCGHQERVWNARPHITPFGGVPCPSCIGAMQHVNWGNDVTAPEHIPEKGDLIFIDTPPELAYMYARKMKAEYEDAPDPNELALNMLSEFGGHGPYAMRLI